MAKSDGDSIGDGMRVGVVGNRIVAGVCILKNTEFLNLIKVRIVFVFVCNYKGNESIYIYSDILYLTCVGK